MMNTADQINAWHETADALTHQAQLRMIITGNPLDYHAGALYSAAEWLHTQADETTVLAFRAQLETPPHG